MFIVEFWFFLSSRRRHTRCALVTGVQTCALPICRQTKATSFTLRAAQSGAARINHVQTLVACRSVVAGWKDRAGDRRQSWPRPRNSDRIGRSWRNRDRGLPRHHADGRSDRRYPPQHSERRHHGNARSEEHTSELQSLMRSSYAVFCLKKKTQSNQQNPKHEIL